MKDIKPAELNDRLRARIHDAASLLYIHGYIPKSRRDKIAARLVKNINSRRQDQRAEKGGV
ncbi:MAG: hypothetical protein AAFW97_13130 [Pseudomonadota bacterium]